MKQKTDTVFLALLFGLLMPFWMVNGAALLVPRQETQPVAQPTTQETEPARQKRYITVLSDGQAQTMELEDYLVGVVLGEMPADFETEALKAQAVVARTYTLRRVTVSPKHEGSAVCTAPDCCQAYRSPESYLAGGGTQASVDKVLAAVEATAGLVLTYEGSLIEATYFSSSGGRTEDAVAVWGSDLPYLRATDSPEEVYTDQVTMTASEFRNALGLDSGTALAVQAVTYTDGGGVDRMTISGKIFQGTQLRQLLGLKSTALTVTVSGSTVTITTVGHGHRVGMSQYGAETMALGGSSFDEILLHYYQGVKLEEYVDN